MCPICRKNGGFLPINGLISPIKGIHATIYPKKKVNNINIQKCGVKLKTKDGFCKVIGKSIYGGLCGIHCKNK